MGVCALPSVDFKVVLDLQRLLSAGCLPDWLRNLAHRRAMVTLDTYQCVKNVLTIGFFDGNAFLIRDIERLAKTFLCIHCKVRLAQACNLQRRTETCARGETKITCPAKKSETPQTRYEKVFYPDKNPSRLAARLVKQGAVKKNIHIHHALCVLGSER